MSRIGRALLGVALTMAGVAGPAGAARADDVAACGVVYQASRYTGGFTAAITVLNIGTETIRGWTFLFPLDTSATIVDIWNADLLSARSGVVTTHDQGWNAVVQPGGSIHIGFRADGTSAAPTRFTVNDLPCQVVS
ncbi:cellulose binding domain-containing protein [Actinoplanes sp. LDG1-06]|uniref:Cellulose binding domain-containing protein n=1 Tax=Paractinoplanes ovalisporus TaxID=2810368 RepID=A0ABS2AL44_9ACTN|nr:cellulose binding domain-containing protein [Actinoplanes ovalisporus]MBM2620510.1 cellulose binding domain-containing protein [Actinoplanes ovalisporus]